jgi:hypothetical protein
MCNKNCEKGIHRPETKIEKEVEILRNKPSQPFTYRILHKEFGPLRTVVEVCKPLISRYTLLAWMLLVFSLEVFLRTKGSTHLNEEMKPLSSVYIPYVKGVSEKFECIGNCYNIRTIFIGKHILRSSLVKSRLERDPQHMAYCICSIRCECGRSYIGETSRPLSIRLLEHRHSLKGGQKNQN